ncbi:MAG: T9SS type A sorting domain-containing protein, partial [Flavobacteriales bacterium]|nr:T9SS type A sorting domain-containing protein [Flavobacteriales bacterium]
DLTPYPNPTAQEVRIPLKGLNGNAELTVRDMAGKVVLDQDVTLGGEVLVVNADRFQNGTYLFDLRLRDGKRSTFRVVVTR